MGNFESSEWELDFSEKLFVPVGFWDLSTLSRGTKLE